jgi:hypothetical protein
MVGTLISIGGEALKPGVVVVVRGGTKLGRTARRVVGIGAAMRPALAAVGRGGGVWRSAYPTPSATIPPTTWMIARVVAALRGDHTLEELFTIDSD